MQRYVTTALKLCVVVAAGTMPLLAGVTVVTPEPASVLLIGGGLAAIILIARKKRSSK